MAFVKMDKEQVLQSIPEDVKRYLKREIESCKTGVIKLHYKFAHYLLTKYESIMDIWVASESTESEIEEIKKAHEFSLKVTDDDIFTIWICGECKSVIGAFKHVLSGVTEGEFIQYLTAMIGKCPICQSENNVFARKGFLLSGGNLEQAMGKPVPEMDQDCRTNELLWCLLWKMNTELKKSIQELMAIKGKNILKDMIKKGQIQSLLMNDKKGNYWNAFGALTTADKIRFGLS